MEREKNQCQCQQTHKRSENQSSIEQKSTQWWVDGSSHFLHIDSDSGSHTHGHTSGGYGDGTEAWLAGQLTIAQ